MRKVYVSGPMRGYPESNYPLFREVSAYYRAQGDTVLCPTEYGDSGQPFVLREAMSAFCKHL